MTVKTIEDKHKTCKHYSDKNKKLTYHTHTK